jgi:multidrug efflux pump subunit AcrA (membrane-fusion protein)
MSSISTKQKRLMVVTRGRRIAIFVVILVVIAIIVVVGIRFMSAYQEKKASTASKEAAAIPVEVVTPTRGSIENFIVRNGDLLSKSSVQVFSKVPGKVISIPVELGSKVGAGSTIAVVDRDEPGFEFVRYRVESPISGEVAAIMVNTGAYINPNTPLVTVIKPKAIKIVTNLTENDLNYVKLGQSVRIMPRGSTDETSAITATVSHISPSANPMNRSWQVELTANSLPPNLRVGDYVSVFITTQKHDNALLLPRDCFDKKGERWYLLTYDNGVAKQKFVTLGLTDEKRFEVLEGVNENDKIIVLQGMDIQDGDKVIEVKAEGKPQTPAPTQTTAAPAAQ